MPQSRRVTLNTITLYFKRLSNHFVILNNKMFAKSRYNNVVSCSNVNVPIQANMGLNDTIEVMKMTSHCFPPQGTYYTYFETIASLASRLSDTIK